MEQKWIFQQDGDLKLTRLLLNDCLAQEKILESENVILKHWKLLQGGQRWVFIQNLNPFIYPWGEILCVTDKNKNGMELKYILNI